MGKDYSNKGEYRSPRAGKDRTSKKKESEGQTLDKKNPKYTEGGIIDTGELNESGKPLMIKGAEMSPGMKETYKNNPGYPTFNKETERVINTTRRGSKERLEGLKENLQNYGRRALAIKPNNLKTTIGIGAGILSLLIPRKRLGGAF